MTFQRACQLAHSVELAEEQARAIGPETVNKINSQGTRKPGETPHWRAKSNQRNGSRFNQGPAKPGSSAEKQNYQPKCRRCLRTHVNKGPCPAVGWKCFACNKVGHIAKSALCKANTKVHYVAETEEEEGDTGGPDSDEDDEVERG